MIGPPDRVAFIGLGNMGMPMAKRLAGAGFALAGYDISADIRDELQAIASAEPADSPEAAAANSVAVVLMLPTSSIVRSVLVDTGLLDRLADGTTIIDMSSSEPMVTRELAAMVGARGLKLLDAPVSGGVLGAASGTLTIMAGGDEPDLDAMRPLLEVLGSRIVHAGQTGAGHALKALNNLLSATSMLITSEAMAIGERFGLSPEAMIDAINTSSGRSFSTEVKFPRYVLPETFDSGFGLRLMAKDMRIALSLGEALGVDSRLGLCSTGLWEQAAAELDAAADHTEIARWVMDQGDELDLPSGERSEK
jgi:3-hydroxyisobutyrate dehydrogenase